MTWKPRRARPGGEETREADSSANARTTWRRGRQSSGRRAAVILSMPLTLSYTLSRDLIRRRKRGDHPGPRTRAELEGLFLAWYLLLAPPAMAGLAWWAYAASGWRPGGAAGIICGVLLSALGYSGAFSAFYPMGLGFAMDGRSRHILPPASAVLYVLRLTLTTVPLVVGALAVFLVLVALLTHLI